MGKCEPGDESQKGGMHERHHAQDYPSILGERSQHSGREHVVERELAVGQRRIHFVGEGIL